MPTTSPAKFPLSFTGSLLIATMFTTVAIPAHAYLDPGTGSLLLQGAIAAIAAGVFTVKTYWYRIRAFIKGEKWQPPELDDDDLTETRNGADKSD